MASFCLLWAVSFCLLWAVSFILFRGIFPCGQPELGLTALHIACKEGHVRMVSYLLRHGANPRAVDVRAPGRTGLGSML